MAGMLYLPRLFVYHSVAEKGSVQSETFKVMERRLLRAIGQRGRVFLAERCCVGPAKNKPRQLVLPRLLILAL
jgi:uncharacterized membrane protein